MSEESQAPHDDPLAAVFRNVFEPVDDEPARAVFAQPSWMSSTAAEAETPAQRDALRSKEIAAANARRDEEQQAAERRQREWEDQQAKERREREARFEAQEAALRKQDDDVHVWSILTPWTIEGHGLEGSDITSEYGSGGWDCLSDDAVCDALNAAIPEIMNSIAPWTSHYPSMGIIRSDSDGDPCFYLVYHADAKELSPETLGEFPEVRLQVPSLPGMTIVLRVETQPVNASTVYQWMREEAGPYLGWGGPSTPDLLPAENESRDEWCERVALGADVVARLVERWVASGRNPVIYRQFGDVTERADGDCDVEFLADKRIPRGCLTFLVGDSGIGKSSAVHEWIAAFSGVASKRPTNVLGADVTGRHVCALISAEDGPGRIAQRARDHAKIWDRCAYFTSPDPLRDLEYHLAQLRQFPRLDLVVFDPVRSFLDGNEDASDVAQRFCSTLDAFAREMNCAIILPHHIRKAKQPPRSLAEVYDRMRGSTAFRASARMVICMLKRRDGTVVIGPCKHNFADRDVWLPKFQGDEYRVDQDTSTLVPLTAERESAACSGVPVSADEVNSRVLAAVQRYNSTGVIVRRSGKSGLFENRPQELSGVSRAAILTAIEHLSAGSHLIDGPTGLHVAIDLLAETGDGDANVV